MAKSKSEEWLEQDKLILLEGWAREGLTDEQIAKNMGISTASLYNYKNRHIEILEALKKGKQVIDYEVENALLKRALGYKYKEITRENKWNEKKEEYEMIITKEVTKEVVPDTLAQIYWLKNRKPDKWRDKVQDTENEEAIINADNIIVKIRKTIDDRYARN